jgi:hypothetical protein
MTKLQKLSFFVFILWIFIRNKDMASLAARLIEMSDVSSRISLFVCFFLLCPMSAGPTRLKQWL